MTHKYCYLYILLMAVLMTYWCCYIYTADIGIDDTLILLSAADDGIDNILVLPSSADIGIDDTLIR